MEGQSAKETIAESAAGVAPLRRKPKRIGIIFQEGSSSPQGGRSSVIVLPLAFRPKSRLASAAAKPPRDKEMRSLGVRLQCERVREGGLHVSKDAQDI